jgi:hypothetical protein
MSKKVLRLIIIYIIVVTFVILAAIGQYPLLVTALTIAIVTVIIGAKIKFLDDSKKFILYGLIGSLICIAIFAILLLLGF